jgi:hypothetical protein
MNYLEWFTEIVKSIKICPHIGEFDRLKDSGHPMNRVITCREDVREYELNYPANKQVLAIFVPGICIYLYPDGTWSGNGDGDN